MPIQVQNEFNLTTDWINIEMSEEFLQTWTMRKYAPTTVKENSPKVRDKLQTCEQGRCATITSYTATLH